MTSFNNLCDLVVLDSSSSLSLVTPLTTNERNVKTPSGAAAVLMLSHKCIFGDRNGKDSDFKCGSD